MGWNTGLGEPYVIIHNKTVTGGVLHDIAGELGKRTGLKNSFVEVPRRRTTMEVTAGTINLLFTHPSWVETPEDYRWSEAVFSSDNIILTRSDWPRITSQENLKGMTLGTIFGYIYPALEEQFKGGTVVREDVAVMIQNISKLNAQRIDGILGDRIHLEWLARNDQNRLVLQPLKIASYPVSLALAKNSGINPEPLFTTLKAMQRENTLSGILQKYK